MNEFHNAIDLALDGKLTEVDILTAEQENYIYWLQRIKESPQIVKDGRGIGQWDKPQVVIVVPEIQSHIKIEYGHTWWYELPAYRRLRPFMENKKSLRFLSRIFQEVKKQNPWEWCYITPYKKSWAIDQYTSNDLFYSEINTVKPKFALCLGFNEYDFTVNCEKRILTWPTFYSKYHHAEWTNWKYKFAEIINNANITT